LEVTVLDIGTKLEDRNEQAQMRMGALTANEWNADDLALVSELPAGSHVSGLPEKRSLGSDFPFRDVGQRAGLSARDGVRAARRLTAGAR
jgi:hypothetical protein